MLSIVPEHRRLAGLLPNLFTVEHYRVYDEYREEYSYGPGYCHVGVVVLVDGSCFAKRARMSNHTYIRKIWFRKSVGQALKRAVNSFLYGTDEPDFYIDVTLSPKERSQAICRELGIVVPQFGVNVFDYELLAARSYGALQSSYITY